MEYRRGAPEPKGGTMDAQTAGRTGATGGSGATIGPAGRPTALLPLSHLVRISAYWLGLTAIDGAVGRYVQERLTFGDLVAPTGIGEATALITAGGTIVAVLVQPTVGSLSDYATTRWGRRKPFIVVGSLLDLVFLLGIATANSVVALAAMIALLSVSTNIARGPFQGYVPDLVAEEQVGLASGLVGLMQTLGNVVGYGFVVLAASALVRQPGLALAAVALVELVTMASVVLRVGNGPPPTPREGRSWGRIALETWGTDILRERSYLWLLASRLAFLTAGAIPFYFVVTFLHQSLGYAQADVGGPNVVVLGIVAVATALAVVPAARLSDRLGRKPVIHAACLVGATGLAIAAAAPGLPVLVVGSSLWGAASGGFLAVDWALMTEVIPRASAGRYMGLSNVATGSSTVVGATLGGLVMDAVNRAAGVGPGPRAALVVAALLYLAASLLLRPVVEPERRRG
jgi:MFS family permease